jgi:O-antigen/teichoic acid export membrane protein
MVRSIAVIAAGYFIFASSAILLFQLSGRDPHASAPLPFMIATVIWGAVFALVGGWLAANLSLRRPAMHAAAVGILIAVLALASVAAQPSDAIWTQLSAVIVMAPCAWLGGVLAARRPADFWKPRT